tara:strand:- start:3362 stop:3463 length:102 start_codon:yes stop_codon:yes gene_type:complete
MYDTLMYMAALVLVWPVGWLVDRVMQKRKNFPY